jgi:xylulokinase
VLVVGIDLGTQSLKAVVCDEALVVRGQHAVGYPTDRPLPDRAEQDPRAWDAALGPAIAGALAAAGVAPEAIAALAITGQLDGCVAVDAAGAPVHPALIWQDRRAVAEAARVEPRRLFTLAGQVADASHMAAKIAWLSRARPAAARFHQPVSYLVERLTGAAVMDPALASTTMLLELATARWSAELCDAFEIRERALPVIRRATDVAGALTPQGARLTGLPRALPVAVGTGDDFAAPLGAGVVAPGPVVCVVGTAEVVGGLAGAPVLDPADEPMVETHGFPTGAFFIENPGWMAGGAVRWAVELLGLPGDAALDALASSAPPGAAGVTFVPALAGAMTPVWRPHARGTLHGLSAGHGPAHVARAVLEGLAFATRDVAVRLGELGLGASEVLLVGGGARSAVWSQIRADALGVPHHVAAHPDATPLGAAMIALVAAGSAAELAELAARIAPPVATFVPAAAAAEATQAAYARYRALIAQLAPLALAPWHPAAE